MKNLSLSKILNSQMSKIISGRGKVSSHLVAFWKAPSHTRNGLPLKNLLLRRTKWMAYMNELTPDHKMILGAVTLANVISPEKADKYLIKMYTKLYKYALNGDRMRYNKIMIIMSKYSKAFRLQLLNHIEPNWMKIYSSKKSIIWYKRLRWALFGLQPFFKYRRIWIPKKDGSKRPLSVPDLTSRTVARAQYIFLQTWCTGQKILDPKNVHGTTLGTGVSTAWKEIAKRKDAKYIFEFDIIKFFDTVMTRGLTGQLRWLKLPDQLTDWIMNTVELSRNSIDRETWQKEKLALFVKTAEPTLGEHVKTYYRIKHGNGWFASLFIKKRNLQLAVTESGLPQGYAPSPLLAALTMHYMYKKWNMITYVDDGLVFSDERPNIDDFINEINMAGNIKLALDKSGWIKYNDSWVKPLKFLGLTMEPDGTISRNNSSEVETHYARKQKPSISNWLNADLRDMNKQISRLFNPTLEDINKPYPKLGVHPDSWIMNHYPGDYTKLMLQKSNRSFLNRKWVSLFHPTYGPIISREYVRPRK